MTLAAPTATELTDRYPAFASVAPATLGAVLAETPGAVDETWIEGDRKPAMLAFAAHLLAAEGYGLSAVTVGDSSVTVSAGLNSVQVGDVKVGLGSGGSSGSSGGVAAGDLTSSSYGRRYLELLRRSNPAVLVA